LERPLRRDCDKEEPKEEEGHCRVRENEIKE
jgi:hypothetical protein